MNRIVRENYSVADLPEDLREGFAGIEKVTLVIEAEQPPEELLSFDELFALRRPPYKTTGEIVAEIRRERDEWDD